MDKQVLLVGGSLQSGNRGVNALTRGTIDVLIKKYGKMNLKIITYGRVFQDSMQIGSDPIMVEEIFCSLKGSFFLGLFTFLPSWVFDRILVRYKNILSSLRNADYILDLSEGDSFSDIYGTKRFILHSGIKIAAINLRKNLFLLPQTIGPFNQFLSKMIAKYIVNRVQYTFVRDRISQKLLQHELKVSAHKVKYIPDMAFYMKPDTGPTIKELFPQINLNISEVIGLNISGLLFHGGYNHKNMFQLKIDYKVLIEKVITGFLDNEKNILILIPHVFCESMNVEDDLMVAKEIYQKYYKTFQGRVFLVDQTLREEQLKRIIGNCDFFVGSRMHACIAAVSMLVPTVPFAYSRKFIGVWEQLGLGHTVADLQKEDENGIIQLLDAAFKNRTEIKEILANKLRNIAIEVEAMFDTIDNFGNR
jgi:colanic acid/amylovoran biosynthesis protein